MQMHESRIKSIVPYPVVFAPAGPEKIRNDNRTQTFFKLATDPLASRKHKQKHQVWLTISPSLRLYHPLLSNDRKHKKQ